MLDVKFKIDEGHVTVRDWMAPSPLRVLFWNVTYACNFRCRICFTDSGAADADELSTREAREMLNEAHAAGVRDIIVSGGEPFSRPDMAELLVHMARLDMTARIATNGSLLDDRLLAHLSKKTQVKSFQVSLDTLDPDLYARTHGTGPAMLEHALEACRLIRRHQFHTTVSVRLTPETLPGIPDLLDAACSEGWATVTVHCPVQTRRSDVGISQDADILGMLDPVFEHFRELPRKWLVETYIPWAPYHAVVRRHSRDIRFVHCGCRAGRDRMTVSPSGALSPCVCMDVPEAYIGNVRTDRLPDVYRDAPLLKLMRAPREHGVCSDCGNVGVCGAGCRASALVLTGRTDGLDASCPVRQAMSRKGGRDST